MADDTSIIGPTPESVEFQGVAISVTPLTIGQIPQILRLLKGVDLSKGLDIGGLTDMVAEHGDQVIDAIAIAARLDPKDVRQAPADEFMRLATLVVEVNADFFVQRLAPSLVGVLERVTAKIGGAGLTPSKA